MTNEELLNEYEVAVTIYVVASDSKDSEAIANAEKRLNTLKEEIFNGCKVVKDFKEFSEESDVILANRLEEELNSVKDKVYTRDLYSRD